MNARNVYAFVLIFFCLGGQSLRGQSMSTREYIDAYKYAAMQEMKVYRIPASITLAQGILESSSGNSPLAKDCNNHFGIKCRKNWTGSSCLADDDAPNECFRGYISAMESYRDHSLFLQQNVRYKRLFELQVTDFHGWAAGLRECGYATNPAYANLLIGVIDRFRLGMYDSMLLFGSDYVSPDSAAQRKISVNGLPALLASTGDSPESIAKRNDMGAWQVYKYNDLKKGERLEPGEIVYLKPKRRNGDMATHAVLEGENMRDISQVHGIRLKQLYKKNRMKPGQMASAGELLYLRKKAEQAPVLVSPGKPIAAPEIVVETPQVVKDEVPAPASMNSHEVRAGETLYGIAKRYGLRVEDLQKWNQLQGTSLKVGQTLVLKPFPKAEQGEGSHQASEGQLETALKYHVVLKGETLYSIAQLYNIGVDSLRAWNDIPQDVIRPGMELKLFAPGAQKAGADEKSIPLTYMVQPGETLYSISRQFGVSVDRLTQLNKLKSTVLKAGQTLQLR